MEDRIIELVGAENYNKNRHRVVMSNGSMLQLGAVFRHENVASWRGYPHDLKAFDEVTEFDESTYLFLCGWLRTSVPGQRCRVIAAGNPPTSASGAWVIRRFRPWLDPRYHAPASPGELRWFITDRDGNDVEVPGPEPVEIKDGMVARPKSRTFIPARVEDNPIYMEAGYRDTLAALPEPLRTQLMLGSFDGSIEEDPWQVIPTRWVKLAQDRWKKRKPRGQMDAVGVDPARGGKDRTVITPRWGNYVGAQVVLSGKSTPDGPTVAARAIAVRRDEAIVNVDVVGIGASPYDSLMMLGIPARPLNGSAASHAFDRSGKLRMRNLRTELWWAVREALDPDHGQELAIPDDPELLSELCSARWSLILSGVTVESKDEIIKRVGRSPDKAESLIYAVGGMTRGPVVTIEPLSSSPHREEYLLDRQEADYRPWDN